jgi:hypothetical protein
MNERLNELAIQAGIEFTYDPTETPMRAFAECWVDELEKFAVLVVQDYDAFADKAAADYAQQLVQANMSNPVYAQAMDEYYEKKWSHRFD